MLRVSSASFSRLQRRLETFTKPDRIEGAPFERDARDRSVPDRKLREQAENADEKPSETPLPGTTDHARSVSEPRGTRTRIAARSLRVRAQSTSIILARRIFARPAPLVSPSRARAQPSSRGHLGSRGLSRVSLAAASSRTRVKRAIPASSRPRRSSIRRSRPSSPHSAGSGCPASRSSRRARRLARRPSRRASWTRSIVCERSTTETRAARRACARLESARTRTAPRRRSAAHVGEASRPTSRGRGRGYARSSGDAL